MSWTNSNRKDRLPSDWASRRQRVLQRANYRCEAKDTMGNRCDAPANQCDHIRRGDDHSLANLQALCEWHHAQKTAREAAEARGPRQTRRRPAERHPGLLE